MGGEGEEVGEIREVRRGVKGVRRESSAIIERGETHLYMAMESLTEAKGVLGFQ
jgi:hypothetical protein